MTTVTVWHGFGMYTGDVWHDGDTGNATTSSIDIHFGESPVNDVQIERDDGGKVQRLAFQFCGGCERWGMAALLRQFSDVLLKPPVIGETIRLGEEPSLEELQSIEYKGQLGEAALNQWLKKEGLSYLYVSQSPETFATLFQGQVKRPDFLILLESIGMIAVDAKNRSLYKGEYSLPFKSELRRVLTFERLFRIPVWYAYMGEQDGAGTAWYWISALKALEEGKPRKNGDTGETFISIKKDQFERIERGADMGKLYTHRLSSLRKIAATAALR